MVARADELKRFFDQGLIILKTEKKADVGDMQGLSAIQWSILESMTYVLEYFHQLTNIFSASNEMAIATVSCTVIMKYVPHVLLLSSPFMELAAEISRSRSSARHRIPLIPGEHPLKPPCF